jgi:hypothetical protein
VDDKRVVVDLELRKRVLDRLSARHSIPMLDLVYAFTMLGLKMKLAPLPADKRDTLSGDVFEGAPIYQLVGHEMKTSEPRRVAHELANAAMKSVADKVEADQELLEIFDLAQD